MMIQLLDLAKHSVDRNGDVFYDRDPADADVLKYVRLPMDFPGYMRVMRLTKDGKATDKTGAAVTYEEVAVMAELDLFTFNMKLYVRVGKDGTLKLMMEDKTTGERDLLAEYERE